MLMGYILFGYVKEPLNPVFRSTAPQTPIWDASTEEPIGQPLSVHTASVASVAFSPDGKRLVSGSYDNTLRIWDASTKGWLAIACNRLQYHPLLKDPEKTISDPEFRSVAVRTRKVCQPFWQPTRVSSQATTSWVNTLIHYLARAFER